MFEGARPSCARAIVPASVRAGALFAIAATREGVVPAWSPNGVSRDRSVINECEDDPALEEVLGSRNGLERPEYLGT